MDFEHDRYLPWLLLWRGVMALSALHLVIDRQFGLSLILPLTVISLLAMVGEGIHRRLRHAAEEATRKQKERESRERRAEEARLRLEAVRESERESQRLGMTFGLDDEPEIENSTVAGAVSAMTAEDFDVALMHSELAEKGAQPSRAFARGPHAAP